MPCGGRLCSLFGTKSQEAIVTVIQLEKSLVFQRLKDMRFSKIKRNIEGPSPPNKTFHIHLTLFSKKLSDSR